MWRQEGARGRFSFENPRGGGGSPKREGGGTRGREVVCTEFGGGELNIFFRGRNAHQGEFSVLRVVFFFEFLFALSPFIPRIWGAVGIKILVLGGVFPCVLPTEKEGKVRAGFWQNGFFADFYF